MIEDENSTRATRIEAVLRTIFAPLALAVVDESARHAGHAGVRAMARGPDGPGETHFAVAMTASAFAGRGRLERHRMVQAALAGEFAAGLHALSLDLRAPGEPV